MAASAPPPRKHSVLLSLRMRVLAVRKARVASLAQGRRKGGVEYARTGCQRTPELPPIAVQPAA